MAAEYAATRIAPSFGSSGIASREKPTSPPSAPSASSTPMKVAPPRPIVTAAPTATTTAAATTCGVGLRRSMSGVATARMIGTVATIVPTVAGSAYRVDSTMNTLNAASPTRARSVTSSSSRPFGRTGGSRLARATANSRTAPAA
ncbi:hypothetical protein Sme01_27850 [Sphaerisporangium melleum]|uniref:Uncharacterized protein n=1 Tax=Sphaerisporangium melleum TaxID=321316 RepID=A0A917QVV4_9ACTN|nr:hypothetical protein GCM10007964_11500 [Sphaerisporangium melleum]GII70309.1 hypothetical protein Sme01_27850 [Sphaerisporangium melleum]